VGSTGTLTVATGKKLTVGADGVLSVGDGTNDVIFRNATIDSKGGGVALTGSTGTAPFLATDELIIAEGGSLETTGSGSVTFIQTTFGGVGTWTASATGGTGPQAGVSGVKIVAPDANGATIALNAGSGLRTAAVLTAGGATPTITQAAAASNALAIKENTTIVLGGGGSAVGSIKLRQGTNPGNLTLADATSIILTGTADAGTVYGSALTSIDSTMVISGITRTEVFQVSDKLTKLTGKGGGASITAKASDSSTNNIDSTTVTVGS
jgi:hypothetical protein